MESWLIWLADKDWAIFKGFKMGTFPMIDGSIKDPVSFKGKVLYPVYLTFIPGTIQCDFKRIRCNCTMYLPNKPYYPDMVYGPGIRETRYYPTKEASNPYYTPIPVTSGGSRQYQLFFVDPGDQKIIKFTIDEDKFFCKHLIWKHSVS